MKFMLLMNCGRDGYLSAAHSPLYVSWARYVVACCLVLPFAIPTHGRRFLPDVQLGTHLLRTVLLVAGMTCYFLAIAEVPMRTPPVRTSSAPSLQCCWQWYCWARS